MPESTTLASFALVALAMVLTPGPNFVYLMSRTISQGKRAGFISLAGVAAGFMVYVVLAALGITALLFAIPLAYDGLRLAGATYLLYLAWSTLKPGGRSAFHVSTLPDHGAGKLFLMGLFTNLLNPKVAVMYLSLLPQFINVEAGNLFGQSLLLGALQISISMTVNTAFILTAATITGFLAGRPSWLMVQRWIMGTVLAGLALRMALDSRR